MNSRITLEFDTDNAAFEDREFETARVLRDVATKVENGSTGGTIYDYNGNRIGAFNVYEGE